MMGGMNYHIELCFEDAVKWIARIRRRNSASPPAPLRDYILESEVATLKFLEGTSVPSPRVFDYALGGLGQWCWGWIRPDGETAWKAPESY